MCEAQQKEPLSAALCRSRDSGLHCAGHFPGAQATGAGVDSFRRTVHHCFDALDVGFPGTIGTPVRVGDLNAEGHALSADITFGHLLHLLHRWKNNRSILADIPVESKLFFFRC